MKAETERMIVQNYLEKYGFQTSKGVHGQVWIVDTMNETLFHIAVPTKQILPIGNNHGLSWAALNRLALALQRAEKDIRDGKSTAAKEV